MSLVGGIPAEIGEHMLDLLDTNGLLKFQQVCRYWYDVSIQYVLNGRLKNRALVSCQVQ
jgi:hypothetical protein